MKFFSSSTAPAESPLFWVFVGMFIVFGGCALCFGLSVVLSKKKVKKAKKSKKSPRNILPTHRSGVSETSPFLRGGKAGNYSSSSVRSKSSASKRAPAVSPRSARMAHSNPQFSTVVSDAARKHDFGYLAASPVSNRRIQGTISGSSRKRDSSISSVRETFGRAALTPISKGSRSTPVSPRRFGQVNGRGPTPKTSSVKRHPTVVFNERV